MSFKAGLYERQPPAGEYVDIVLVDLPHISNFTDFEPLLGEPDTHLRVVRQAKPSASPTPSSCPVPKARLRTWNTCAVRVWTRPSLRRQTREPR